MGVGRRNPRIVLDTDVVPVPPAVAGIFDHPGARGENRRSASRGKIGALVHPAVTQDRMPTHAEGRRQPRTVDRRAEQGTSDALSIPVDVFGNTVTCLEPVDLHFPTAQDQRRGHDVAIIRYRSVGGVEALEQHAEMVTGPDVALEIDIIGEGADYGGHDPVGNIGLGSCLIKAGIDG